MAINLPKRAQWSNTRCLNGYLRHHNKWRNVWEIYISSHWLGTIILLHFLYSIQTPKSYTNGWLPDSKRQQLLYFRPGLHTWYLPISVLIPQQYTFKPKQIITGLDERVTTPTRYIVRLAFHPGWTRVLTFIVAKDPIRSLDAEKLYPDIEIANTLVFA